jgi:DNA primase
MGRRGRCQERVQQERGSGSLILVESYLSVFRLCQAGFANAVALMDSTLSDEQEELIARYLSSQGHIILLFDNDVVSPDVIEKRLEKDDIKNK